MNNRIILTPEEIAAVNDPHVRALAGEPNVMRVNLFPDALDDEDIEVMQANAFLDALDDAMLVPNPNPAAFFQPPLPAMNQPALLGDVFDDLVILMALEEEADTPIARRGAR